MIPPLLKYIILLITAIVLFSLFKVGYSSIIESSNPLFLKIILILLLLGLLIIIVSKIIKKYNVYGPPGKETDKNMYEISQWMVKCGYILSAVLFLVGIIFLVLTPSKIEPYVLLGLGAVLFLSMFLLNKHYKKSTG
jgi:hypothetical protein